MVRRIRFEGLDFDDVLLVPNISFVDSRDDVSLKTELSPHLELDMPIIASPMKGIISPKIIIELDKLGGLGILHRFHKTTDSMLEDVDKIVSNKVKNWGFSVGLGSDNYMFALDDGAVVICVDVANGYLDSVRKYVAKLSSYIERNGYEALVMAGNVINSEGVASLESAGAKLIRVGIGSGTLCTTRNYTGVGYPQISALLGCNNYKGTRTYNNHTKIIADGGIRNSGDAVKALSAGADAVMLGTLFAKTEESSNNGIIYGMASRKLQSEYYHSVKSVEGIEKEMEKDTTLKEFIEEFTYGIRSACTYLNAKELYDLRNASFVVVKDGSIKKL